MGTDTKRMMELAIKTSLIHTRHFCSKISNSLKISRHSNFDFFFAVRYFRESMDYTICEIWGGRGVGHLQLSQGFWF